MANLFPETTVVDVQVVVNQEIKFGRSYAFDFEKGDFVTSPNGKVIETKDHEAWIQWCFKALQTPRYRSLVYSRLHGQEFDDLISRHLTRGANESEIQRITIETLMRNPRTASVNKFAFQWIDDAVYFECAITDVYGRIRQLTESVVNG